MLQYLDFNMIADANLCTKKESVIQVFSSSKSNAQHEIPQG